MAIKIFLKHLITGIRRRPVQPLLLVTIIIAAITICSLSIELKNFMEEETGLSQAAQYGNADIAITVASDSQNRYLYTTEAKQVAKIYGASVCGLFQTPFYYEVADDHDFVLGVAADFDDLEDIFDIQLEGARFNDSALTSRKKKRSVYVTEEMVEKYGWEVGKEISLNFLGYDIEFTVRGISKSYFLGEYSVLVQVDNIIDAIKRENHALSFIDEFEPYGKLYVNSNGANNGELIAALREVYPDFNLSVIEKDNKNVFGDTIILVVILALMTAILAIFTIYSCFAILTAQRKDENALFYAVGAKSYMLNAASAVEMFIYWLIGMGVAVAISNPIAKFFIDIIGFTYITPAARMTDVLLSGGIILASSELGLALFIIAEKARKLRSKKKIATVDAGVKAKTERVLSLGLVALVILTCVLAVVMPQSYRGPISVFGVVVVLVTAFYGGKNLFKWLSGKISRSSKMPVTMRYAVKNSYHLESSANLSALISVFIIITILAGVMFNMISDFTEQNKAFLNCDYVIMNSNAGEKERLAENDIFQTSYDVAIAELNVDGNNAMVFSATDIIAYEKYDVKELPQGLQVVVGEPFFNHMGYQIGDNLKLINEGNTYELQIIGTAKCNGYSVFVDAPYVGIDYNFVAVKVAEAQDMDGAYGELFELVDTNSVIASSEEIMRTKVKALEIYKYCIGILLVCIAIFSVIGLFDNAVSGFRSRRGEFECYKSAGMSKHAIARMLTSEVVYSILMGIFITALLVTAAILLMYECCLGYLLNLFYL